MSTEQSAEYLRRWWIWISVGLRAATAEQMSHQKLAWSREEEATASAPVASSGARAGRPADRLEAERSRMEASGGVASERQWRWGSPVAGTAASSYRLRSIRREAFPRRVLHCSPM
uniref:Uncharacterized protein n=1 Tax=Oryza brachyantha TaxID=4533 RepID=J3MZ52_ORYBR